MNALGDYIRREVERAQWDECMRPLRAMSVAELRALWDSFGEDSYCGEHDCVHVHTALNEKGDGAYCAV